MLCKNSADPGAISKSGDLKLTLTNGTTLYGLYEDGGTQAETEGLYITFSDIGISDPPNGWDTAMLGNNASVYTYWKCAEYKAGICIFQKTP